MLPVLRGEELDGARYARNGSMRAASVIRVFKKLRGLGQQAVSLEQSSKVYLFGTGKTRNTGRRYGNLSRAGRAQFGLVAQSSSRVANRF